jgi:hypothetical protein
VASFRVGWKPVIDGLRKIEAELRLGGDHPSALAGAGFGHEFEVALDRLGYGGLSPGHCSRSGRLVDCWRSPGSINVGFHLEI